MYRASFTIFIITNKCTINIITVYITTVSLCNLHPYMFRRCRVTIRQFKTDAFLSDTRSSNCSCWIYSL